MPAGQPRIRRLGRHISLVLAGSAALEGQFESLGLLRRKRESKI